MNLPNIIFNNPYLLLLAIPMIGIWIWSRSSYKSPEAIEVPTAFEGSIAEKPLLLRILPYLPLLATLAWLVALSRPQSLAGEDYDTQEGIDIMMVMDLSSSMLAMDFDPNRLEVSKELAAKFVSERIGDRIGLVIFGGEAATLLPATSDRDMVVNYVQQLDVGFLKDGTAIGMGLATAVNRLKEIDTPSKIIILLTDGENTAGYIDPLVAAQIASDEQIKVYAIAIGTDGVTQGYAPDAFGNKVPVQIQGSIDEALLSKIASITKGKYYRARTEADLNDVYKDIDKLEKSEAEVKVTRRYKEHFRIFILVGMVLMMLYFGLKYFFIKTFPL